MTYRQLKWLILIIPTVTIGIWEYVRHEFLYPALSMEMGNLLAPVIVFLVTVTLVVKLFGKLEALQEELNRERAGKAILEERERLARELHDGIAQSLFMLSVKADKLEQIQGASGKLETFRRTVRQVNDYVRQAISSLRHPPEAGEATRMAWARSIQEMLEDFRKETGLDVQAEWTIPDEALSAREKVELYAIVKESLTNVHKHAGASRVKVACMPTEGGGFRCLVEDDGRGFEGETGGTGYGWTIMRERAREMGWKLRVARENRWTQICVESGDRDEGSLPGHAGR